MSFDSTCRWLAEQFPEDFASWLLGRPIVSVALNPTELSLEPIRADNLMLLEGETDILHIEWQTSNPEQALRDAVKAMGQLADIEQRHEVLGAAYLLSGLVLDQKMISKIIRRDVMRESVTYQAVLEEGREEGIAKGRVEERRSMIINFLREGVSIELIAKATGLSIVEITQLKQENHL